MGEERLYRAGNRQMFVPVPTSGKADPYHTLGSLPVQWRRHSGSQGQMRPLFKQSVSELRLLRDEAEPGLRLSLPAWILW